MAATATKANEAAVGAVADDSKPTRHPLVMALLIAWVIVVMAWWAVAFYPIGRENAEWLQRTREVCFGAGPNQLPSAYGWIMLVAGPLLFLAAIVATFYDELQAELKHIVARAWGKGLAAVVVVAFVGQWFWIGAQVGEAQRLSAAVTNFLQDGDLPDYYPRTDEAAPKLALTDQFGVRISIDSFRGSNVILAFVYAHCATVCPTLVSQVMKAKAAAPQAKVMLITLDPWRDTPGSLPALAQKWSLPAQDVHLLSGDVPEVLAALTAWGMPFKRDERTGVIDHPGLVYVIDGEGVIAYKFNNPPVAWIAQGIARVAQAKE